MAKHVYFQGSCSECGCHRRMRVDSKPRCAPCGRSGVRTHGMFGTALYEVFSSMLARCGHKKNVYQHPETYAGRGISVCEEWLKDRGKFFKWALENGYAKGLFIDRIDNDRGYSPENCRWVTPVQSSRNRRTSVLDENKVAKIKEALRDTRRGVQARLAREFQVSPSTISDILHGRGWRDAA